MSKIFLKWFGGMRPRMGDQHLSRRRLTETGIFAQPVQNTDNEMLSEIPATEAENCNLYSGELRPLRQPALAHRFCKPTDDCWRQPIPDDPSVPPVEPPEPPDCVPAVIDYPVCGGNVYECDSLSNQLNLSFARHWPMSDAIGSGRVTDVIVGETLENRTNILYEQASLYPDVCADVYAANGGWDNIPIAPVFDDWTVGHVGSLGGFAQITGGPATSVIALYWNSGSIGIELNNSGADVNVSIPNANQVTPITYVGALSPEGTETTPFILLNYNVDDTTGFATVEVFKNFVSLGVQTTAADPTTVSTTNRYFRLNTGFNNTGVTLQNVVYNTTETSPETISALRQAWLQNQITYVDPNPPGCTLEFDPPIPDPAPVGFQTSISIVVNADATTPVQYQWYRNNIAIPGEVGPVLNLTLTEDDSYASYTALVQNPCSQQLTFPLVVPMVGFVCMSWECDALRDAITRTNPISYYPMRGGYTELSISSGNVVSGDILYDVTTVNDLEFIVGGGNVLLPEAASLLDTCEGTAFNSNSLTSRPASTTYTPTGGGSLVAVWTSPTDDGSFGIDAAENQHIYINNGAVQVFPPGGPLQSWPIPKVAIPDAPATAYFFIVTWAVVGNDTEVNVYDHTGLAILSEVATGKVFAIGSNPPSFVQIGWLNNTWQDCALYDRVLSPEEIQTLADATLQNLTSYLDPDPLCQPCKQYECDALSAAIIFTVPDFYYPMNHQSDIDNYATVSHPIRDYSGNANHLRWDQGRPVGMASSLYIDTCEGVQTGAAVSTFNLLRTDQGDTIQGGLVSSDSASMIFHPGSYGVGDKRYGEIRWKNTSNYDNGIVAIYYTPSDSIRWTINNSNQFNTGAARSIDIDFSAYDADWASGMVGIRAYPEGSRIRCDFYLNFVQVDSQLVPLVSGQTTQSWAPDRPIFEISACSSRAGTQEHATWLRKLSDAEWAQLADAWDQNSTGYVDPNEFCGPPCPTWECDSFSTALDEVMDSHWLLEDGVTAGTPEPDVLGFMDFPVIGTGGKSLPIMQDECFVTGSTLLNPGILDNTSPPAGLPREGGYGLFARASFANQLSLFKVRYGSICNIELFVSGGAKVGLSLAGFPSYTWPGITSPDTYIWVNWNLVETTPDNWDLELEVFYDFVSQGVQTLSSTDTRTIPTTVTAFQMGFGGTGRWDVQHAAYSQTRLTTEQIATLKAARDRNRPDWVDPNPPDDCIPVPP